MRELEAFLNEIAVYDDYVRSRLEEFKEIPSQQLGTTRITNVIQDNRKLLAELETANRKIEELTRVQQSLGELKHTLRGS